jgi:formylglycine-generating enzyme required for sulfatase activity
LFPLETLQGCHGLTISMMAQAYRRIATWRRMSLARARHETAIRVTILLSLITAGSVDLRAAAQKMAGQSHSRMAVSATVLSIAQEKAIAAEPGSDFTECASGCPIMIVIPAGKFTMGSPESEPDREDSEGPQHEVTIAEPLAVSKFEVSFEEWDACVVARQCPDVAALGDGVRFPWSTSAGATPSNMWLGFHR